MRGDWTRLTKVVPAGTGVAAVHVRMEDSGSQAFAVTFRFSRTSFISCEVGGVHQFKPDEVCSRWSVKKAFLNLSPCLIWILLSGGNHLPSGRTCLFIGKLQFPWLVIDCSYLISQSGSPLLTDLHLLALYWVRTQK